MLQAVKGLPKLNDSALLRNQAYVNGAWVYGR
jgi:succinate-semialdehyde dehydrogenase/glutarate-semialdehyde dehydrogenase